jgi:hypothetical protein
MNRHQVGSAFSVWHRIRKELRRSPQDDQKPNARSRTTIDAGDCAGAGYLAEREHLKSNILRDDPAASVSFRDFVAMLHHCRVRYALNFGKNAASQ